MILFDHPKLGDVYFGNGCNFFERNANPFTLAFKPSSEFQRSLRRFSSGGSWGSRSQFICFPTVVQIAPQALYKSLVASLSSKNLVNSYFLLGRAQISGGGKLRSDLSCESILCAFSMIARSVNPLATASKVSPASVRKPSR